MMELGSIQMWWGIAAVCAALAVGVVSPGPSFVMVARTAVAGSRMQGVAAAVGMGFGGLLYGALALAGLQVVLSAVPALYLALKVGGGAWLMYLGWRIWRGASQPLVVAAEGDGMESNARNNSRGGAALALGFFTQISNPKTALVYASVFAALLPTSLPVLAATVLLALVFVIEAGWYALVAVALSARAPRAAYLRWKRAVDRVAGAVLGVLGVKLVTSA